MCHIHFQLIEPIVEKKTYHIPRNNRYLQGRHSLIGI
jgi:hypothetical protein